MASADPISGAIAFASIFGSDLLTSTASVFIIGTLTSAVTYGAVAVGLSVASGLLGKALSKKQDSSLASVSDLADAVAQLRNPTATAVTARQMVVGRVLKSGPLFFRDTKGTNGQYLYMGMVLAAHEIDGVEQYWIGNSVVATDPSGMATAKPYFDGMTRYVQFSTRLGTDDQQIDPILAQDWPTLDRAFRQQGLACLVLKAYRGVNDTAVSTVWGTSGSQPTPMALIRGKRFFDPRDASQVVGDSSTYKWSNNSAIVFFGWFTDADGPNVSWADINLDYFKRAADACDVQVPKKDGTFEPAFRSDGVIDTSQDPSAICQGLLASMNAELTQVDGQFAIVVGAPRVSERSLSEDSARGTLSATMTAPWSDTLNTVRTSFVASERDYQVATGPVYQDLDALDEDGTEKSTTIEWDYVGSGSQVQRLCKAIIRRSRLARKVTRGEDIEAIRHVPTDIVTLAYQGALSCLNGDYEITRIAESTRLDEFSFDALQYDGNYLYGWNPAVDEYDWSGQPATGG